MFSTGWARQLSLCFKDELSKLSLFIPSSIRTIIVVEVSV